MANIKGLEDLIKKLNSLSKDTTGAIEKALDESTLKMVGQAKLLSRVNTGAMRASIINEVEKESETKVVAQFGTNIEYAIYNELGTSKMSAQPFITPGFEAYKNEIPDVMRKYLLEELNK